MASFIFIISASVLYFYIYPSVTNIEEEKVVLKNKVESYSDLLKKGLKFGDFKKAKNNFSFPSDDSYLKDFFSTIKKDNYEKLLNISSEDSNLTFNEFLDKKKSFVEEVKKS
jgi:hypothetical protein